MVADRMGRMPSRSAFLLQEIFARGGVLLYFVVAIAGTGATVLLLPVEWRTAGQVTSILIALSPLVLSHFLKWSAVRDQTDMKVLNRLLRVMETAEAVQNDLTRADWKVSLTRDIERAARFFRRSYARLPGLPRQARKARRRHARQCAAVLRDYADIAMHGDRSDLLRLREDYARAVLRVGSGNWSQVANLNPSVHTQRRFWDFIPAVSPLVVPLVTSLGTIGAAIIQYGGAKNP
jgi:membrane protein implicated in regulation of membrane protease activity